MKLVKQRFVPRCGNKNGDKLKISDKVTPLQRVGGLRISQIILKGPCAATMQAFRNNTSQEDMVQFVTKFDPPSKSPCKQ